MRVNKNTISGKIILHIPQQQFINPDLELASTITTQLLTEYMEPSSPLFLGNRLTMHGNNIHPCTEIIDKQMLHRNSLTRLRRTYKQSRI